MLLLDVTVSWLHSNYHFIMDHSASYKIILLGEVGVGKTSLFNRIRTGKFCDTQSSTGGLDCCYQYSTTIDNDRIMVKSYRAVQSCYVCMCMRVCIPCKCICSCVDRSSSMFMLYSLSYSLLLCFEKGSLGY